MVTPVAFVPSSLDGEEPGGFIVVNVDAPLLRPYQILEDDNGGYYPTLEEARQACQRFREESGNDQIYIYAVVGVREALELHPSSFRLA